MPVVISEYDPAWPKRYEAEAKRVRDTVGPLLAGLEHIGSTAVPGLAAKPVIDMLAGVREAGVLSTALEKPSLLPTGEVLPAGNARHLALAHGLIGLGFAYYGENGIPGRLFFKRTEDGASRVHLHVVLHDSELWRQHVAFRDYLRAFPAVARQYEALKRALARQHKTDRDAYTTGKAAFITQCLRAADSWLQN